METNHKRFRRYCALRNKNRLTIKRFVFCYISIYLLYYIEKFESGIYVCLCYYPSKLSIDIKFAFLALAPDESY